MLSPSEISRYQRHLNLPQFSLEGQEKLKAARVLVVGAGGLGSPIILYLAAAGVGTLGIIDFDKVDLTNLQRQILFTENDIGKSKAQVAAQRVAALNSHVRSRPYECNLTSANALDIIPDYDIVVDGTDNFPTRYLINDACSILGKPFVYGSIFRFEGQLAVFNYLGGPTYRDLFPEPPEPDAVPNCAEGGVIGVLPGIIGTLQANEVIKVLTGIGEPLSGRLMILDALTMSSRTIKLSTNKNTPKIDKLIDYDEFCHRPNKLTNTMKEVTVQELKQMIDSGEDFQLIDVREPYEYEAANLDGELIPLQQIPDSSDKISKDKKVIVHCRSGARSAQAIQFLEDRHNLDNLYNLKGGIMAWGTQIDPSKQV